MGELKKVFRPELLNRIDEIIVFHKLEKSEILQIVDLMMKRLRDQMAIHGATIELTDDAKELLVEQGYDPAMGARPLRRSIQRLIEDPLADFVLGRDLKEGSTIVVDRRDERGAGRVARRHHDRRGRGAGAGEGHRAAGRAGRVSSSTSRSSRATTRPEGTTARVAPARRRRRAR